jgi:peptidoglycan/LPS O-acetylase OafA/YrhL
MPKDGWMARRGGVMPGVACCASTPLYVVFLLVCWLVPVKTLIPHMTGADVLTHLAVIDAQWHTWSIAVELKYYLLLPFLVLAYVHVARRRFLVATLLAGAGIGVREWLAPEFHVYVLSTYVAIFLTGSWLAIAHRHLAEHPVSHSPSFRRACGVIALALFALLMAMTPSIWGRLHDAAIPLNHWHRSFTLFGLLWGGVLLSVLHAPSLVQKAFAWLPLRVLGVVSFSAYLWHAIVLENLDWLPDWGASARAALVFAAIVLVSVVSYLLIERPFLRIGGKRSQVRTHEPSGVVPPRVDSAAAADEVRS